MSAKSCKTLVWLGHYVDIKSVDINELNKCVSKGSRDSTFMLCILIQSEDKVPSFCFFLSFQLFRRVAAALPGMESIQEPSKQGSILWPIYISWKPTFHDMTNLFY